MALGAEGFRELKAQNGRGWVLENTAAKIEGYPIKRYTPPGL